MQDRVALVTGATSGIGEATAFRLHERGYTVYAVGRDPDALDALRVSGLRAASLDVTDAAAVSRLAAEIHAAHGAVDVLVNSAGFPLTGPIEQVDADELRRLFETNVIAMLRLTQAVLPRMRERGTGTIVNIGSTAGRFTAPGSGPYHIVKYGVEALSLALRGEVAGFGVRVVLLDPTGVRTPFVASQLERDRNYADDDPYAAFKRRYAETTRKLTEAPGVMIEADTVARAVLRAVDADNPRSRYVVGLSGKATVFARRLLPDRVWEWVMARQLGL